jgi:hypothetical protein
MKIQILLLISLITFSKASTQEAYPFYKSADNAAITNLDSDYRNSSVLLEYKESFLSVNNHVLLISSNKNIASDIKKGAYFHNNQFKKGELLLKDGKTFKMDYKFRLSLVSGDIELKNRQNEVTIVNINDVNTFSLYVKDSTFSIKKIQVRESPYFYNDEFQIGELILTRDRHYKSEFRYRYNQFTGILEVKYPDNQILTIEKSEVLAFSLTIEDKIINFIQVPLTNKPNEFKLLQVIYFSPNLKLLRDSQKGIQLGVQATNSPNNNKHIEMSYYYKEEYHYYLSNADKTHEVELTEKSLSKVLPNKKKELKKLFSQAKYKQNLTVSKVFDLMKALDKK